MARPLTFFVLFICIFFSLPVVAQLGCGGFDGAPQPSGGVNSVSNGDLCLNLGAAAAPAIITIQARNVADGNNPNNFAVAIDWDDGSPIEIIQYGGAIPISYNAVNHEYVTGNIQHRFLERGCDPTRIGRQCTYKPRVFLRIAGVTCPAEFGNPPDFFRYNTDDRCSGEMRIAETVTGDNIFEVCAGVSTTITFTDNTQLNCLAPSELTGVNNGQRRRRFVYGVVNTISGPNPILVGGVAQAYPFNGPVELSNMPLLVESPPPYPNNLTLPITVPATASVGEEFHIRMDYWNFCNPFPGAPVSIVGIIRIVDQPPPPVPDNHIVCSGTNPLMPNSNSFRINFGGSSSRVFWFQDNAGVPGAPLVNPNGVNSKNFPVSAFPGGINVNTPGVYRLWASYQAQVSAGGPSCESIRVPITLTIREPLPVPGPISGPTPICNNSNNIPYQVPITAATMPFGGATEYEWRVVNAGGTVVTDVTLTPQADGRTANANFNIATGTFGGAASIVRRIQVRRRYVTGSTFPGGGPRCESQFADYPVTVFRNTVPGTISGGDTKCEGEILNSITWTPGVGSIVRWEMSVGGGPFNPVPSFGTNSTVNPTSLSLDGSPAETYEFRAVVRNGSTGPCSEATTNQVIYNINTNPTPANAGPSDEVCSAAPTHVFNLSANAPGVPFTGQWAVVSAPAGPAPAFSNINSELSNVTLFTPGSYILSWSILGGPCNSIDTLTLEFGRDPAMPNAGADDDVCGFVYTLNGSAPTFEVARWTLVSGPGNVVFDDDRSPTSDVTVDAYGTYQFRWTFSSGGCTPQSAVVNITFHEPPVADAGLDQRVCADGANIAITGTISGGATQGRWRVIVGGGTFLSSGNPVGNVTGPGPSITDTYNPVAGDYALDSLILAFEASNPGCTSPPDQRVIKFDLQPAPAAVGLPNPLSTCSSSAILNGVSPTNGGIGTWGAITLGPNILDVMDRQSPVSNLQDGANQFRWTVTSTFGVCPPSDAIYTINKIASPLAINHSPSLCETTINSGIAQNVDLTVYDSVVNANTGLTVTWYVNPARTVLVPDPTNENVSSGELFYVRVSDVSGCSGDAIVNITINPLPFFGSINIPVCEDTLGAGFADNQNLRNYDDDVSLGFANRQINWFLDAGLTTPVPNPNDVDGVVNNLRVYAQVVNTATLCYSVAEVTFILNARPTDNPIQGPNTVCLDPNEVVFFQVDTFKPNHSYNWTIPPGQADTIGLNTNFYILLQFPAVVPGGVTLSVQETTPEGCAGNVQQLTVIIEDRPGALTIVGPNEVCENETDVVFKVQQFPGLTYAWNVPPGASVIFGQGADSVRVNFASIPGDVTVTPSTTVGCVGPTDTLSVVINRRPLLANLDKTICSKDSARIILAVEPTSVPAAFYSIPALGIVRDPGLVRLAGLAATDLPVANADSLAFYDQVLENKTGGPLNVRYTVVPVSAKNCAGSSEVFTLRINPEPQIDPNLGKGLCSGTPNEITLRPAVGSFPADRYLITSLNANGLSTQSGSTPPLNTPLLDDAIFNDTWINPTGGPIDVTYTIAAVSTLTGCIGDPPIPLTVSIFPKPILVDPGDLLICSGSTVNIPLNTVNIPTATMTWFVQSVSGNILGSSSGVANTLPANIPDLLRNLDPVRGRLDYVLRAKNPLSLAECESDTIIVRVEVDPAPEAINLDPEACSDVAGGPLVHTELLSNLESAITSSAGITITWFEDAGLSIPIPGPNYSFQNGIPVFVNVENNTSGCTKVTSVVYTVNPQVSFTQSVTNLLCNNDNSGTLTVNSLTGTPIFAYSLDGGPFINAGPTYTFQFLQAGIHSLEVRDAEGCSAINPNILITEPTALTATLVEDIPISCFLAKDGQLRTDALGGTPGATPNEYTYRLLQTNTNNNTGLFAGLGLGTYNVRVSDANGCVVDTTPLTLDQPDQVVIDNAMVVADAAGFHLSCRDAMDGQIEVTASGGLAGTDYTLNLVKTGVPSPPPFQQILNAPGSPASTFTGLPHGTYTVRAVDVNGCESLPAVAVIINPPPFNAGFVGINQSICEGEDAQPVEELVPPFGGIGNYQYQWQFSVTGSNNDAEWFDIAAPQGTAPEFDPSTLFNTTFYRRKVRSGSCPEDGKQTKVEVTVNPLPAVTFSGPSSICQGDAFFLQIDLDPLRGTAPIEYDYSDGSTIFSNLIGGASTIIPVSNFQNTTTYTLLRVKDLNGCVAPILPAPVTVDVLKVDPNFSILGPDAQCPGGEFVFQWTIEPNIKYTWLFADGTQRIINPGDRPPGVDTVTHIYTGSSAFSSTVFPVRLQAENAQCTPKFATKPITLFPNIVLNILPQDTILCSGESLRFKDQSLGVDNGKWFYRLDGTNGREEEQNGPIPQVNWVMTNTTTVNPIVYEAVYEVSNNEGCTDRFTNKVLVYRGIDANFNIGPVPDFMGGVSTVTFTNTSDPIDPVDFEYNWNFGDPKSVPVTGNGIGPYTVDYFSPGIRDITLSVVNINARNAGETCESRITKQINVVLPQLGAMFTATPRASCFPVDIVVTNNSPGADTFLWEVYSQSQLVTTSNLRNPVFRILNPGVYDIYLTASYSLTGQTAFAELLGIQVFDVPKASFTVRPDPVYIPDTELQTFNYSIHANQYNWDFDDGTVYTIAEPKHTYQLEGKYTITLAAGFNNGLWDVDGDVSTPEVEVVCYDTARVTITALDGGFAKIPNAFTPNPNQRTTQEQPEPELGSFNDVFLPITRGVEEFSLQIFDRWGTLIFESTNKNFGWDGYDRNGRLMPAGVYVYKLTLRLSNGQRTTKLGDVTLIR